MKKTVKNMKRTIYSMLMIGAAVLTLCSCKPSYVSPLSIPDSETKGADEPYDIDFVQINNNIIDTYSSDDRAKIFPFIKNLEIDGSNDEKYVSLTLDVVENTSDDAVDVLLSDLTKQISDEGQMQDFRFTPSSDDDFGTFFDVYNYKLKVTRGSETLYDETIKTNEGESIPFDPSLDVNTVKEALASMNTDDSTTAENSENNQTSPDNKTTSAEETTTTAETKG